MELKRVVAATACIAMLAGLGACSSARGGHFAQEASGGALSKGDTIGLSMPTKSLERWNKDGARLQKKLQKAGYKVILSYADNKTSQQAADIENMANNNAKIIAVAAIDGTSVGPAVEHARDNGAKIIAYDRLIMDTKAVDYYSTFDLEQIGTMQGKYIIDSLGLKNGQKGPFNVEVLSGDPKDNNAKYFFKGAWKQLQPYYKSGVLRSRSNGGVTADFDVNKWQTIGVDNWDPAKAQVKMESILDSAYSNGEKLDAVLAPNDAIAVGAVNAIQSKRPDMKPGSGNWPIITGQDCDAANVTQIAHGIQSMSIFKDVNKLSDAVYDIIIQLAQGQKVKGINKTYNNNRIDVPTKLLVPQVVTKDNLDVLESSGFFNAAEFKKLTS